MAKYSLGTATTKMSPNVKKDELYLDASKANPLKQDMVKQFEIVATSLANINSLLTKAVNKKVVTGQYAASFKGWAKKCKTQSTNAKKRKTTLDSKYNEDVKNYTIKILGDRITALEAKIAKMSNE